MTHKFRFLGWGLFFAALIILGAGLIVYSAKHPSTQQTADLKLGANEHSLGKADAPAVLVEYADFQCPACGAYFPLVEKLAGDFPDKLLIVYRYFPLVQIHANALASARAAEAAGRQGKFEEMKQMLFTHQSDWAESATAADIFKSYAAQIGLAADQFTKDLADPSLEDKIKNNVKSAQALGVNSTPTFYLNGLKIQNPRSYDDFKALVQEAIDNAPKK